MVHVSNVRSIHSTHCFALFNCDTAEVLTLSTTLKQSILFAGLLFTECYSKFIECVLVYFHIIISEIRYMIWCRKQARALAFSHWIAGGCVLYKFIFSFAFSHSPVSFQFCHTAVSIQYTHTPRIEFDSVGFFKRTVSHLSMLFKCYLNALKRIKSNCTNIICDKVKRSKKVRFRKNQNQNCCTFWSCARALKVKENNFVYRNQWKNQENIHKTHHKITFNRTKKKGKRIFLLAFCVQIECFLLSFHIICGENLDAILIRWWKHKDSLSLVASFGFANDNKSLGFKSSEG